MKHPVHSGAARLRAAYDALAHVVRQVGDDESWRPTGCLGWAVRDLTHHCLGDAQRALVALHTPTRDPVDRDAVTYWGDWAPDGAGAAQGRRQTRVAASMFLLWGPLQELYVETAEAVVHAAGGADPAARVRTQGHVLTVEALLSTLCVEASIHHLDLVRHLPWAVGPTGSGLAEARRVVEGLLGPAEVGWSDERAVLVATGRARPTADEARRLGARAQRLPLFA